MAENEEDKHATQVAGKATSGYPKIFATDDDGKLKVIVSYNPSPSSDLSGSGSKVTATAGENLAFGEICYLKSDGKLWKADASAVGTMPVLFMAMATILADADGVFLKQGFARDDSWTWTVGASLYASETAGEMTETAPSTLNSIIQKVGWAYSATKVFFEPVDLLPHITDYEAHNTVIRKTTDETVNNSDTLQNDDELLFAMAANEVWAFTLFLVINSGATPDFKFDVDVPENANALMTVAHRNAANASVSVGWSEDQGSAAIDVRGIGAEFCGMMAMGVAVCGATPGNLVVRWAQNTANASDTKVLTNSYIIAHRLA